MVKRAVDCGKTDDGKTVWQQVDLRRKKQNKPLHRPKPKLKPPSPTPLRP